MLYACTCSTQEESNSAHLKTYHLHDHCLLSKWKHVMCAETPLDASTQNDKSRVEKESTSVITGSVTFQLRMRQKPFIS